MIGSEIYNYKRRLLEENKIAVFRIHDTLHICEPDGIVYGVAGKLGWNMYREAIDKKIFNIPEASLMNLITALKNALNIDTVRYIGNIDMKCKSVGLLVGAAGGEAQIECLVKEKIDVLICGEATEWEAVEYVRDAVAVGSNTAIIILGHALSEEPGMEYMAGLLKKYFPGMPIAFIPAGNPLSFL